MSGLLESLTFFSTSFGLMVIGAIAGAIILFWEWRIALVGLFVIQLGVATVAVRVENLPAEWAGVMTIVTGLTCLILALSAQQTRRPPSLHQSGTFLLRAMALVLLFVIWQSVRAELRIPEIVPQVAALFVWLGMCVLVMLALSDNPLFHGVALLMWTIPVQAVVGALLGIPALIVLIGMIELIVALACSYLVLAEQLPVAAQQPVLTDIVFPEVFPDAALREEAAEGTAAPGSGRAGELALAWWRGLHRRTAGFRQPGSLRDRRQAAPDADHAQGRAMPARKQP